jgi:hypothetical protein
VANADVISAVSETLEARLTAGLSILGTPGTPAPTAQVTPPTGTWIDVPPRQQQRPSESEGPAHSTQAVAGRRPRGGANAEG